MLTLLLLYIMAAQTSNHFCSLYNAMDTSSLKMKLLC